MILKSALKFARLRVTIMLWALVFVGSAAAGDVNQKTVLALLLIVSWYIHATTINDYADLEIDKINIKKATDRPLLDDAISRSQFWFLHYCSAGIAISLSIIYGIYAVAFTLLMLLIDYIYSLKPLRFSDRGLLAQCILAFSYTYFPLALGHWSVTIERFPWALSYGIFAAFIARMLLKDFRDKEGDEKYGKRTYLLRHGQKNTVQLSALLWLVAALTIGFAVELTSFYLILGIGFVEVYILLRNLLRTSDSTKQQIVITFIAKAGNALIITLLVYLLSKDESISYYEREVIVGVTGVVLLGYNWLRYLYFRSNLTIPRSASTSTS